MPCCSAAARHPLPRPPSHHPAVAEGDARRIGVNDGSEVEVVEVGYQVGLRAPEFGMTLLDGSRVTTANIVDEGKPVLLYFHATY